MSGSIELGIFLLRDETLANQAGVSLLSNFYTHYKSGLTYIHKYKIIIGQYLCSLYNITAGNSRSAVWGEGLDHLDAVILGLNPA
jgi:hypothetical protein